MGIIYRCLIIDDETPAHKALISHISKFDDLEYAGSAYSGIEALRLLNENPYDIIFLDINMPVISGVELMEIQPVRPLTIVTTAYSDYALAAYENDAVDYLLKPISPEKFSKAIEKARAYYSYNFEKENISKETLFSCRVNGEIIQVPIHEIVYFESFGNYMKLYRNKVKIPVVLHGSLVGILEDLKNTSFLQIHRTYIVNRDYIKSINGNSVKLMNDTQLPVGRKYKLALGNL